MNNLIKKYQENIKYIEQKEKEIENLIKPLWQDNIDKYKAELILFAKDNLYGIKIDNGAYKYELEKELKNGLIDYYENIKEKINKDIKNNKKEINILKQNNKKLEKEIILLNNEIINIKGEQLSFL